ncbi:MAG: phosphoglycerate mutase family protein [Planctomycetia bacterium]|nr:phosphoglycerate mutase family protein [Planctomycetia bacterium]
MLKIILLRPGSTEFDAQHRILGTLDVPLSTEGATEVAGAVGQLRDQKIEVIYCTPCQSASETAEALAEAFDIKCKPLKTMQNVDHGLWQGLQVEEVKRKQPRVFKQWQEHPETICPPEGEMLTAAQHRVEAALAKLLKKHRHGGTIALVAPEPLAGVVRSFLLRTQLSEVWKTEGECGTWDAIEVDPAAVLLAAQMASNGAHK